MEIQGPMQECVFWNAPASPCRGSGLPSPRRSFSSFVGSILATASRPLVTRRGEGQQAPFTDETAEVRWEGPT